MKEGDKNCYFTLHCCLSESIHFSPVKTLFLKIYFSWRLITLQYCSGFCHTFIWISHELHAFPILKPHPNPTLPSSSHPSGSSQCISPKHPVSCIEPGLATCFIYDNIHVSMPFIQIIPPSPSPTESNSLFCTSVSLFCLAYSIIITIFLNFSYMC